jgi:hypothetical protein
MKSLFLVLAVTGCDFNYEPDVGAPFELGPAIDGGTGTDGGGVTNPFGCDNSDSDPTVAVSFAQDIRPLQTRVPGGCSPCHLGRITSGFDQSSYVSLRRGGTNSGTQVIVAGKPCDSILLKKIGRAPPFGSRMPFNGPPYFTAAERQLVHDWIAEGALNN